MQCSNVLFRVEECSHTVQRKVLKGTDWVFEPIYDMSRVFFNGLMRFERYTDFDIERSLIV